MPDKQGQEGPAEERGLFPPFIVLRLASVKVSVIPYDKKEPVGLAKAIGINKLVC